MNSSRRAQQGEAQVHRVAGERCTLDVFHREEGEPAGAARGRGVGAGLAGARVIEAGLENLGDAGVMEAPESLGLVREPRERLWTGDSGTQKLDGDAALRAGLFGKVDDTEAALTQDALEPIGPDTVEAVFKVCRRGRAGLSERGMVVHRGWGWIFRHGGFSSQHACQFGSCP